MYHLLSLTGDEKRGLPGCDISTAVRKVAVLGAESAQRIYEAHWNSLGVSSFVSRNLTGALN